MSPSRPVRLQSTRPAGLAAELGSAVMTTRRIRLSKLIRFRLFIGVVCLIVFYLSASFAHGLYHGPDQGRALNLLRFLLGEVAAALSIVSLLGFIWAVFAPRWVAGLFRFAWRHFKYALYVFYAMLGGVGIYAVVLRLFER